MDMLLRSTDLAGLTAVFERHAECSSVPELLDPGTVERARELAHASGLWAQIETELAAGDEIPVLKRSLYRAYERTGDRGPGQAVMHRRGLSLRSAALALWLEHPDADTDRLQDLLWAYCDDFTWVMAAHERCTIDLGSAGLAADLADVLAVLGERIEPEVVARVRREVHRRVLDPYLSPRMTDFWLTSRHNWNHVCNGSVLRAALCLVSDPRALARIAHTAVQNMTYALDGFTDDGGCVEGPGYWEYGFGHFVRAAHALHARTGGEIDLMRGDKIARICRYPLAAHLAGSFRASFADAGHGFHSAQTMLLINRVLDLPELFRLCARSADGTLKMSNWQELALYDGTRYPGDAEREDCLLPDLGLVKLHGASGPGTVTLAAIAGNNGVNHNHNDIGSFLVHRNGRLFLTDPGAPIYTRKTFSAQRYEIVFCSAAGHSVPVIDGTMQQAGAQYRGTVTAENLNEHGVKQAVLDLSKAYPEGTLLRFMRRFTLNTERNTVGIEDRFVFAAAPRTLEERFVTYEPVAVADDGHSVRLGPVEDSMRLTTENPGRFTVERLEEESKEGRAPGVLTRITFTPAALADKLCLRFELE